MEENQIYDISSGTELSLMWPSFTAIPVSACYMTNQSVVDIDPTSTTFIEWLTIDGPSINIFTEDKAYAST